MLTINVAQLLKETVGSVRRYSIDDVTVEGIGVLGDIQLLRTNRTILVTGRLHTSTNLTCSRCLEECVYPLTLEIEEEFALPSAFGGPGPTRESRESGLFAVDEDNILDLTEAVRQYVLLNTPMKLVCRSDCAGLCPSCGCNLNQTTCGCTAIRRDSPWAKLETLRCRD